MTHPPAPVPEAAGAVEDVRAVQIAVGEAVAFAALYGHSSPAKIKAVNEALATALAAKDAEIAAGAVEDIDALERFILSATEFLNDWKKGDFDLPTLAALDAQDVYNKQPAAFLAWRRIAVAVASVPDLEADIQSAARMLGAMGDELVEAGGTPGDHETQA